MKKRLVFVSGMLVTLAVAFVLALTPQYAGALNDPGSGGGGTGSANTIDCSGLTGGAKEQCEEIKQREASRRAETDLGRDMQEQGRGPILETLVPGCNNEAADPTRHCIFVFTIAVFNLLAMGVGIAVIGGIIYGSIVYTASGGAPDRSKQGITIITNALIGLVAYFLMWSLINWLVPGGLFN